MCYFKYFISVFIAETITFCDYCICNKAEEGRSTTPNSQHALDALALDYPLEYARLALDGEMQAWVDAEDSMDVF